MTPYQEARDDFEYLESLAEVSDMVDIDAMVFDLMRDPTKKKAAEMYGQCVGTWMREHGHKFADNDAVCEIAQRHEVYF